MLGIDFLVPNPPLIHNCHRGNCVRRAKYSVFKDDEKVEDLCLHHAIKFCEKNQLHLPKEPDGSDEADPRH